MASDGLKLKAGSNITITTTSTGEIEISTTGSGGGDTDTKTVKVSSNDTTADFLKAKIVAGEGITLTENLDGGNETLTIASSGGVDSYADLDTRVGLTIVELSAGTWSGDAPARASGEYPILFVGTSDPADPTNGIDTPGNINTGDTWIDTSA